MSTSHSKGQKSLRNYYSTYILFTEVKFQFESFSLQLDFILFFFFLKQSQDPPAVKGLTLATKVRKTMSSRVHEAVKAIALCHNVTPVYESNGVTDQAEAERHYEDSCRVYQASSPDEVSLWSLVHVSALVICPGCIL